MKKSICLLSALLLSLFVHNGFAETKYRVTSLGFMSDFHKAFATSINNQNEITGFDCDEAGLPRAFKYSDGLMMDIGAPSGTNSRGKTINNSGTIGGAWSRNSQFESAYIYENGNINTIGDQSNHEHIGISAINDNGVVVGSRRVIDGRDNAFMYKDGSYINITDNGGYARDINNYGQVVGKCDNKPFLFENGTFEFLPVPAGVVGRVEALGINDQGQVLMESWEYPGSRTYQSFIYDLLDETFIEISSPDFTYNSTRCNEINEHGTVLGNYVTDSFQMVPYIYENGSMNLAQDLLDADSTNWRLGSLNSINASGYIVGYGFLNNEQHAILLSPVPEPATIVPIDIQPQSCPNPLNVKSNGVLPIAVLGSEEFDVNDIDPNSLEILGVKPIRYSYEDVAAPADVNVLPEECICTTDGSDGYPDMTLKFDTPDIIEAIGEVEDGDYVILTLTGSLKNGTPIEGTDCVLILKKGKQ